MKKQPHKVQGHDFLSPDVPRACPYGIYDIGRNTGFVIKPHAIVNRLVTTLIYIALVQALNAPEGDVRAFERLVLRHQSRVVANCRGITRDFNNAEDLAQEVFVKAFFGLRGFERKSSFGRWLQRIKINHCLNHLKKHVGRSFVDVGDAEAGELDELKVKVTAEQLAVAISDRQAIIGVLGSMPSNLRIPLVLCDMDGLSYEEVAGTLGIGLSATKMRIKRARDEFRFRYEKVQSVGAAPEGGR